MPGESDHRPPAAAPSIDERLKALSADFARELPRAIAQLRIMWTEMNAEPSRSNQTGSTHAGLSNQDRLKRIHDIVHRLAGGGQSFGFSHVGQAAAPLDELLSHRRKRLRLMSEAEKTEIERLIGLIEQAAALPARPAAR
jgi:HPt (histidine-containing phosphotransfer) domain-containing protein